MDSRKTIEEQLAKHTHRQQSKQPVLNVDNYMFDGITLNTLSYDQLVSAISIIKDPYIRRDYFQNPLNGAVQSNEYPRILQRLLQLENQNRYIEPEPTPAHKKQKHGSPSKGGMYKRKSSKQSKRSKRSKRSKIYSIKRHRLI